jgi:hypothetical protein
MPRDIRPNLLKFAKALYALHQADCLADSAFKPAVGELIRKATETRRRHETTHFRSRDAARRIAMRSFRTAAEYNQWCCKNLRHEHMVPTSVIREIFVDKGPTLSLSFIKTVLRKYGHRATITRAEDKILNKAGLKRKMPEEFWIKKSKIYRDPCARYVKTELFGKLVSRASRSWFRA